MNAKDTVMSDEYIRMLQRGMPLRSTDFNTMKRCIKAQAETTGKIMYDEGFKVGTRTVVEWINGMGAPILMDGDIWQGKLKDWGIAPEPRSHNVVGDSPL